MKKEVIRFGWCKEKSSKKESCKEKKEINLAELHLQSDLAITCKAVPKYWDGLFCSCPQ